MIREGPLKSKFEEKVKELGINVEFNGRLPVISTHECMEYRDLLD